MSRSRYDKTPQIKEAIRLTAYDEASGTLIWLPRLREEFPSAWSYRRWNEKHANRPVGHLNALGYLHTTCKGVNFPVHQVIFFIHHQYLPEQIDHINGVRADNRISNLRAATSSQNCMNRGITSRNKSGHKGVRFARWANKWVAYITVQRKQRHLGYFDSCEKAVEARRIAAIELHGDFARLEN